MAKLRREAHDPSPNHSQTKPLRIVASGTLFLTHVLSIPSHPTPSSVVRAHSVEKTRGGSANTVLSILAQFQSVEAVLVAPLSGNDEGQMILRDLEHEGVITRYCKIWKAVGVPSAWVLHSVDDDTRTIVNHNPLPDITHEEFVQLLGPLLAPENYPQTSPVISPTANNNASSPSPYATASSIPRPSQSGPRPPPFLFNPNSPAPFDWLHFEGRSVKTTLSNITGLDGLARERKWRSHCVFSVDVGRKGRQGVEALIPHADIIFVNKHYAEANSPHYATTPRSFLLFLTSIAPAHALLVAYWGKDGAAVLSMPTKEYFQSSGWVEERPLSSVRPVASDGRRGVRSPTEELSVRSGSDFWAGARGHTPSSSAFFSAAGYMSDVGNDSGLSHSTSTSSRQRVRSRSRPPGHSSTDYDDDNDSQATEVPGKDNDDDGIVDEVGAQDAFIAGMIYSLSRRICPGSPYTPSWTGNDLDASSPESERGRWRLDECLRFATELAGRKARRRNWDGLADEMVNAVIDPLAHTPTCKDLLVVRYVRHSRWCRLYEDASAAGDDPLVWFTIAPERSLRVTTVLHGIYVTSDRHSESSQAQVGEALAAVFA
ncbi:putative pfkB family carbohydrate kinase [Lyophyllum shimeji]|uniref:PfkB family carbohydrate kinase n=1 Tax=Lyophyllum shimeji TaxID=47721 RepID=A0A9P3PPQ9_LYOSH|nr:putative pfkB family carbohydrate kinase [Lyophyllum shimeji]